MHVKTLLQLHSFPVKLTASPSMCVMAALSLARKWCGENVTLLEVSDTVSMRPMSNWADLRRVPEGGITITTTSPSRDDQLEYLLQDAHKRDLRETDFRNEFAALHHSWVLSTSLAVRKVVVQVITVAAGTAQLDNPVRKSMYWTNSKDIRIPLLANALGFVEQDMRSGFDAYTTICNHFAHLKPLSELDKEVATLVRLIIPALEAECPLECKVLEGYEMIKEMFPEKFV